MAAIIRSVKLIAKLPPPSIGCLALCDAKDSPQASDPRIHRVVDISDINTLTESMIRRTEYFLGMQRGELELTFPGNSFEVRADMLQCFRADNIVLVPDMQTMNDFHHFIEKNYGRPKSMRTRWDEYYKPAEGIYTAVPICYVGTLCLRGDNPYGRRAYWKPYKHMPRFHATVHPFLVLTRLLLHHRNILQYSLPGVSVEMRRMMGVLRAMLHARIPENFRHSRPDGLNTVDDALHRLSSYRSSLRMSHPQQRRISQTRKVSPQWNGSLRSQKAVFARIDEQGPPDYPGHNEVSYRAAP